MSLYIKLETLEYPRHEGDIRLEHPEITEDQTGETFPCPPTYAKVEFSPFPDHDPATHKFVELLPENVDGVWSQKFQVVPLTEQEIADREAFLASLPQIEGEANG